MRFVIKKITTNIYLEKDGPIMGFFLTGIDRRFHSAGSTMYIEIYVENSFLRNRIDTINFGMTNMWQSNSVSITFEQILYIHVHI